MSNHNIGNRELTTGEKISKSLVGKFGEKSRNWKGELAGYVAKHSWIRKHFGRAAICENMDCSYPKRVDAGRKTIKKPSRYEWANISKKYKRDKNDYIQLCPSCHRKWDMGKIILNLKNNG